MSNKQFQSSKIRIHMALKISKQKRGGEHWGEKKALKET